MCSSLVFLLQAAEVSRTVTSTFVWSWTICVNVNEGTQDPENWTQYSSSVSALFTVYAQQTPVYLTWVLLRVCAACPTPRSSSVPPGTTSTIRSHRDRAGYNRQETAQASELSFPVVFHTENCVVHSENSTVSSVYLPTPRWHLKSLNLPKWIKERRPSHDIFLFKYHFLLHIFDAFSFLLFG